MALVTPIANITVEPVTARHVYRNPNLIGLVAGEALLAAAPCHIESDGMVYMSNGTADNADAVVDGFTGKPYVAGEPVTLYGDGAIFEYAAGLTPGAKLYLGTTDGRLDTSTTTGDSQGIAKALDAKHIQVRTKW